MAITTSSRQTLESARKAHREGRYAEAEVLCHDLLERAPADGEALYLLGLVLHQTGRETEAETWLRRAAALAPRSPNAYYALGCVHAATGDAASAAKAFASALKRNPAYVNAYYAMGNACFELRDFERAVSLYRQALALHPQDHELWNNLGRALEALLRTEEALAAYERAVEIQPEFGLARSNHALALLSLGRLQEGLREYEWRWRKTPPRPYPQPFWRGQSIPGKTLLVCAEQGLGDVIQFVRFTSQARARAGQVILECQAPLKSLIEHSRCADTVIAVGETPPPFDYYVPVMSLPLVLGTTLETIPLSPWLVAPAVEALSPVPHGHFKVGLAWAGNPTHFNDGRRSIPFRELEPILAKPGVTFFSLQVVVRPEDQPHVDSTLNLVSLAGRLKDFYDTAGCLGQMDLVLSVDTAVAHLAGTLGKPVWVLVPHPADWRWLLQRTDSAWYPTMRLFRQSQSQPGQWQPVVARVAEELDRWVASQHA
ncbi:MAG TPA: tetratricopeptide repeat-containing glycosyltransferase family protein [Verrucomicrobiae bacterium]|nr:tetratricopeptide repeat-containing glycosyltransferase family protein [Verrucomicrobiae bacterium]